MWTLIVYSVLFGLIIRLEAAPTDLTIIGGHDANIEDHPWQVALETTIDFYCGGSIIAEQWVLTAAHCGDDYKYIRAGSNNKTFGGVLVKIDKVYIHPDYNSITVVNDIALIHLESPINTTRFRPVALPSVDEDLPDGTFFNITGWGALNMFNDTETLLQLLTIPILNQESCQSVYVNDHRLPNVTDAMLCGKGVWKGPCKGDSGGPAVINGKVIGIVSWSVWCALPEYPSVFTRVSSYLDWIHNITGITTF